MLFHQRGNIRTSLQIFNDRSYQPCCSQDDHCLFHGTCTFEYSCGTTKKHKKKKNIQCPNIYTAVRNKNTIEFSPDGRKTLQAKTIEHQCPDDRTGEKRKHYTSCSDSQDNSNAGTRKESSEAE